MAEKLLYVALDKSNREENLELAQELAGSDTEGSFGFKVNQDDAMIYGRAYISEVVDTGRPVFVDLKMNNGPRTMSNAIRWLGDMGVAHTNVWAHAESNLRKTVDRLASVTDRPAILAVTFYTRWKENYAQTHHRMSLDELISHWAYDAVDNGADGVILPPNLLRAVKDLNTVKLSPAIRMEGQVTDSQQEQVSTPYDTVVDGGDILVAGSPVYKAAYPVEALKTILGEMRRGQQFLEAAGQ
jgi:orotidine-5'-phosphate decarboxylase